VTSPERLDADEASDEQVRLVPVTDDPEPADEPGPGEADELERDDVSEIDDEPMSTLAVFEGDEGSLDVAQRRALVVLIKQRFISNRTHPREWAALVAQPRPIRARLNDLFLELVFDLEREVAYKRQVTPEGGGRPFPTLLYDAPWGREETLALAYLRTRHRNDQAAGADRSWVDRSDIVEYIAQHRPENATDRSGDARKAHKAVENIFKTGLLIGPSTGDRFEISDAIEVLLPLEKLTELLTWLRTQNDSSDGDTAPSQLLMTRTDPAEGDDVAGTESGEEN
jgi:hypothetical protein